MARYYVEKDGEWNIFSTVVDDFLFDEFICIDALKARLLYERFKELTEDIDSLMTDKPKVNVMPYEEAVRIADRKTENSSEKPNNCDDCIWSVCNYNKAFEDEPTISKMEQVEDEFKQFDREDLILLIECQKERIAELLAKDEPQKDCKKCKNYDRCKNNRWKCCVYEPKDEPQTMIYPQVDGITPSVIEPQTETEIAKAIVHKMIDDAVIAEDAYPDLRQKMHDAVDEFEPQTDCAWR